MAWWLQDTSDARGLDISQDGYHWLGGLLEHAQGMCALTNPTVNSYKRINAPATSSGATWSPNTVSYCGNNRTHMVRVPSAPRFEFRLGATTCRSLHAACTACCSLVALLTGYAARWLRRLPLAAWLLLATFWAILTCVLALR